MERLAKRGEGIATLTEDQKKAMAEIANRTKAKIAEIEILYGKKVAEARAAGDAAKADKMRRKKMNGSGSVLPDGLRLPPHEA